MKEIKNIVLIGAGNLGTHLGLALHGAGKNVVQVISRQTGNAEKLARRINAEAGSDLRRVKNNQDLYILAVNDHSISEAGSQLGISNALVVHTSGAMPVDVLQHVSANTGVLYPLSAFSREVEVDFRNVHVFVEAQKEENTQLLMQLATSVSDKVHKLNSGQRQIVHLSAVFASNFSNHMYAMAQDILQKYGLDFDLLRPIIFETARKVMHNPPSQTQTGPAVRKDFATVEKHLEILSAHPECHEIYRIITQNIIHLNKKERK